MTIVIGIAAGVLLTYVILLVALLVARPKGNLLEEALRLVPDLFRLSRGLVFDKSVPRGARVRLWLLLGYLAVPFDIVPDFLPVLGYADDAIVVTLVFRSVIRSAGGEAILRHWSGSPDGLAALSRVTGMDLAAGAGPTTPPSGRLTISPPDDATIARSAGRARGAAPRT